MKSTRLNSLTASDDYRTPAGIIHIRWMIHRDMLEVLAIEAESFAFAWCKEDFVNVLRCRNCIGMIAELGDKIVAFMVYELEKTGLMLLNCAVAEGYRRNGMGAALIDKLVRKLSAQRRRRIVIWIRESNLDGQMFFRSCGFKCIKVMRDAYDECDESAYVFQYRVGECSGR